MTLPALVARPQPAPGSVATLCGVRHAVQHGVAAVHAAAVGAAPAAITNAIGSAFAVAGVLLGPGAGAMPAPPSLVQQTLSKELILQGRLLMTHKQNNLYLKTHTSTAALLALNYNFVTITAWQIGSLESAQAAVHMLQARHEGGRVSQRRLHHALPQLRPQRRQLLLQAN